jgi:predicted alpha/beta-fold hydrolase
MQFGTQFSPRWLTNTHIQTILSFVIPQRHVSFTRRRIETPDRDYLDLDFPSLPNIDWNDLNQRSIVVVLHGLGGSARGLHLKHFYFHLLRRGFRPIGLNHRGCSGQANLTQKCQHFGASDDVATTINWIRQQWDVPIGLVGISAGGNIVLKYLAEQPNAVFAAAAISPSFDFFRTAEQLASNARFYQTFLLRTLKKKICRRPVKMDIDIVAALRAKTLRDFDDIATSKLNGFNDVGDYYTQCNPAQFLPRIRIPTLIIRAVDDPFHSDSDILYQQLEDNAHLEPLLLPNGGHVGFLEPERWGVETWAQATVAQFCHHWQVQNND